METTRPTRAAMVPWPRTFVFASGFFAFAFFFAVLIAWSANQAMSIVLGFVAFWATLEAVLFLLIRSHRYD